MISHGAVSASVSAIANPKTMAFEPGQKRLNRQALATLPTAAIENVTTGRCAHALAKTVLVATFSVTGLKSTFHSNNPVLNIMVETS